MADRFLVQKVRDGKVLAEFPAKYAWTPPVDNKPAALEFARWFKRHYGLASDTYRVVYDL